MDMKWFEEVFLPTFEVDKERRINRKQFGVFDEHLPHDDTVGRLYYVWGNVGNLHIVALQDKLDGYSYLKIKKIR